MGVWIGTNGNLAAMVRQLWFWVLIAIAAGILFGLVAPDQATNARWLADAFIQLIKTITGPVIFVTVIIGIASLGDLGRAGGLALRALGYFFVATVIALALGLAAANLIQPGAGVNADPSAASTEQAQSSIKEAGGEEGVVSFVTDSLLPDSLAGPFVENEILRVLVLAILVAAAISTLREADRRRVVGGFETVSQILFRVIRFIMYAAPLGAFGGMAYTVAAFGAQSLTGLLALAATFWGTCAIFVLVVLGTVSRVAGFNVLKVIRLIKDELLIIVGTSSSETVLPRLLRKLEAAGASRQTVGMVIPTGYSFNLDGTCIYLTIGALFILQAAGQDIALGQQLALAGLMILTSKGAAGITGAGLVTLTASLQAFGGEFFTAESIAVGIALVVGIDRVMSEGRAITNAIGNSVATLAIARWQGELDLEQLRRTLDDPSEVNRLTDAGAERPEDAPAERAEGGIVLPAGAG